jgi:c-di-GMP-binding flagellar brake protein YcgR
MSFLDTEPAAIHQLDGGLAGARFRVTDPRQRLATLRELQRGDVPLSLGLPGQPGCGALLWALDERASLLHFSLSREPAGGLLEILLTAPTLWVAGYLHEAKVQFEIDGAQLAPPGEKPMLHTALPQRMVHLPRRRAVRVRRDAASAPTASVPHPLAPELLLQLRVADISMTGCALWQTPQTRALSPGIELRGLQVMLDAQTGLRVDAQVRHVTPGPRGSGLARVGCDWRGLSPRAADHLQAWIAQGRRRRELVSLVFD